MTAQKLRQWRGVKPVAGPAGVAISTRLRTTPEDEHVLDLVADHMGGLRRADLAAISRPQPLDRAMDEAARRRARRDRLNTRKKALTAESSARWANAVIAGNDDQYRLARDAQHRHIVGLRAAIATIEKRLAQPTGDTLTPEQRRARRKAKLLKGYPTQPRGFRNNAACSGCGPNWTKCALIAAATWYTSPRAVNGWPRLATTSTRRT